MIAKDESDEILASLEPLVNELSGWTLCDTGSTDDTIEVVEKFFDKHDVPGKVANHKWQDFGHNRNLCIKAGIDWSLQQAKRQGKPSGTHYCDYLMFIDADQILNRPPEIKPGELKAANLTKDSYHMTEKGVGVTYVNVRLVSTRLEWEWVGEVHEYVHRKDGIHTVTNTLPGYWFHHDASGGKGGNRFVRDEVILSKAVKERPTDDRARFYYANTLRALGRTEEAIYHYLVRIQLGRWDEERFMSALTIADLAKKQFDAGQLISQQVKAAVGNFDSHDMKVDNATELAEQKRLDEAVAKHAALLNAFKSEDYAEVRAAAAVVERIKDGRKHREFPWLVAAYTAASAIAPYRPEPYTVIAKMYRILKNDFSKCYSYAVAAVAQGAPKKDALFVSTNIADYEAMDEVCVCGFYVEDRLEEGNIACRKLEDRLVADLELSPGNAYLQGMLDRIKNNLVWYGKKLPEKSSDCSADGALCDGKLSLA